MSLINEALKKAQTDRPAGDAGSRDHAMHQPGPPHSPPGKRKRSPIWGFLLAVLIIGLFSASISTVLVYKILGEDEAPTQPEVQPGPAEEPESQVTARETEVPAQLEPQPAGPVAEVQAEEPVIEEPAAASSPPATRNAGVTASGGEPVPVPPEQAPVAEQPAPEPAVPNAALWERLEELEIRGMMSGGTKVLIYDSSNGKTRSYVEGDLFDGALGLRISAIQSNSIVFEDYAGNELSKSF